MMKWIGWSIAACLLARAVYTDVKQGRIENKWMAAGFVSGLFVAYGKGGVNGVLESVKMAGILLAALFILFLIKGLGGGDVKLFCVLAVFFPNEAVSIVVASFFVGGLLALGKLFWRWVCKRTVYVPHETMNFSIPIVIGTGMTAVMQYIGGR